MIQLMGNLFAPFAILLAVILSPGCQCCETKLIADNFTLTQVSLSPDERYLGLSGYARFHSNVSCEMRCINAGIAVDLASGELVVERNKSDNPKRVELSELENATVEFSGEIDEGCTNCQLILASPSKAVEVVVTTDSDEVEHFDRSQGSGLCVLVFVEGDLLTALHMGFSIWDGTESW